MTIPDRLQALWRSWIKRLLSKLGFDAPRQNDDDEPHWLPFD
jgi:hypothetical protein